LGLNELRLIARPGGGLLVRRQEVLFLLSSADDAAAPELLAAVASLAGGALVEKLFDVVRRRRPDPVAAFCALVEDAGEIQLAIHGKLTVEADSGAGRSQFASTTATSRVEETLGKTVLWISVGKRTPKVAGEGYLDLVTGTVSAAAFELVARGAAVADEPATTSRAAAPAPAAPPTPVAAATAPPTPVAAPAAPMVAPPPPPPPPPVASASPSPPAAPAVTPQAVEVTVAPTPGAEPQTQPIKKAPPSVTAPTSGPDLKKALTMAMESQGTTTDHPAAPEVMGRLCAMGHLNNPASAQCWICGSKVGTDSGVGPRPPLGRITTKDKRSLIVDGNLVFGRKPEAADAVTAGRARAVEIPADHRGVSRAHAEIVLDGWTVLIRDLGSANGTYVMAPGESQWRQVDPAKPMPLVTGSSVTLGDYEIFFEGV